MKNILVFALAFISLPVFAGETRTAQIHVGCLYTADVLSDEGQPALEALCLDVAEQADAVYWNSGVDVNFTAVATGISTYDESDKYPTSQQALSDLFQNSHAGDWKVDNGVDLLILFVQLDDGSDNPCGDAYVMGPNPSVGFSPFALSVMDPDCGNTLWGPRLIGHMMGLQSDPDSANTAPSRDFAYGHCTEGFRTVMVTEEDCPDAVEQIGLLSNPFLLLDGEPLGTEDERDNALAAQMNRFIVQDFEPAVHPSDGGFGTIFSDGFESGNTDSWSSSTP